MIVYVTKILGNLYYVTGLMSYQGLCLATVFYPCFIYAMTIDKSISKLFIHGLINYKDTKTKNRHLKN
jgi:hypothetical protein